MFSHYLKKDILNNAVLHSGDMEAHILEKGPVYQRKANSS